MLDGSKKLCRVYQQCATPPYVLNLADLPMERRPSNAYLNTIKLGARESQLPDDYQFFLESIPHNGYDGKVDVNLDLCITKD